MRSGSNLFPGGQVSESPFLVAKTTLRRIFTSSYTTLVSTGYNTDGFDHELWKKNARTIELYVIGILIAAGALGNILSVVVLKRDRQRRESLFLLRVLALADLFYLIFATLRYPAKYILPIIDPHVERSTSSEVNSPMYVRMQPIIFPCLKTTQTVTIWMTVLVTVDRFAWVRFPQNAFKSFNTVTRRRYALLVCLLSLLYNTPRFMDSKVFQLSLPCLSIHPPIHPLNLTIHDKEDPCVELGHFGLNLTSVSEVCGANGWNGQISNIDGGDDDDNDDDDDDDDEVNIESYFLSESMQDHYVHSDVHSERVHYTTSIKPLIGVTIPIMPVNKENMSSGFISQFLQVTDSFATLKIERNNKLRIPEFHGCTKRTVMTYRLQFSGPLYHNVYIDGMHLFFNYLLPLSFITCINLYLIYAVRKSTLRRHRQGYEASFKFVNKTHRIDRCNGNNSKEIKDLMKDDYSDDDVIPPIRGDNRLPGWHEVAKEKCGERQLAFGRHHSNCPEINDDSCGSLIHNRNYLQQFQEHSEKYPHFHQQCHCYHGNRRHEALQNLTSNRLDDVRNENKRYQQVNVSTRFKKDTEKRLHDRRQDCEACKHVRNTYGHVRNTCNHVRDTCNHGRKSRHVTVWLPFGGSNRSSMTSVHYKHEARVNECEVNATLVLIVVVAVFVACESLELVLRFVTFIQRNLGLQLLNGERLAVLTFGSELTVVLKSTLNFLIYVIFGRRFRSFLKKLCPLRLPVLSSTSFVSSPQKQAVI